MVGDRTGGAAPAVHRGLSGGLVFQVRALRPVWDQLQDGLQVARAVRRRRTARLGRSEPSAPHLSASHQRRRGGASVPGAKEASGLGAGAAARLALRPSSGNRMASDEYRGRLARPPWLGGQATVPAPPSTPGGGGARHRDAERSVDGLLQATVHHARRHLVLSPHDCRSAHTVPPHLSGTPLNQRRRRQAVLRARIPRVWIAVGHLHGQRGAVRHDRN